MSEYLDGHPNLQRQSTIGDVIYVHYSPRSLRPVVEEEPLAEPVEGLVEPVAEVELPEEQLVAEFEPEPEPMEVEEAVAAVASSEEEPEVPAADVAEEPLTEEPTPEPAPPPVTTGGWPFRVAPQGYAVEFGTGRLVPIVYAGMYH